ncbi:MAG: DUF1761 domain-containing protein [Aureispira sp.]
MNLLLACLAGGLVSLILRAVWYHSNVFGGLLNQESNKDAEDLLDQGQTTSTKNSQLVTFAASFVLCAYMSYEMKWVNHPDELNPFLHGMYHGARNIGVFAVGAIIIHALAERKSIQYTLIHAAYWLITFAFIGGVLASFPSFRPKKAETSMNTLPYQAPAQQESILHLT